MFSGQTHQGLITLIDDQYCGFKIEFWDCYCVGIKEEMSSNDHSSMQMTLRLSPAITRNRKIGHQKSWRISEIFRENTKRKASHYKKESTPQKNKTTNKPEVVELFWLNKKGEKIKDAYSSQDVMLYLKLKNVNEGKDITIKLKNDKTNKITTLTGVANNKGEVTLKKQL